MKITFRVLQFGSALLLPCLLASSAWAERVTFSDGRVCSDCTVSRSAEGRIAGVFDAAGKQWLTPGSAIQSEQKTTSPFRLLLQQVKENFKDAPSEALAPQIPWYGSGAASGQCQFFGNGTSYCY